MNAKKSGFLSFYLKKQQPHTIYFHFIEDKKVNRAQ